jgi:putative ABC transport system permease protein
LRWIEAILAGAVYRDWRALASIGPLAHLARGTIALPIRPIVMPLIVKLAARNLLHDRLRFIATIVGIVFSIVLVTVQLGLFVSFERTVTVMIEHAPADLWIVPLGTKCFEDPSLLDESDRYRALSIEGVNDVVPIVISFAQWRMPGGGTTPVLVVGSDLRAPGLRPWNIVEGSLDALSIPDSVAIDRSYFERLGSKGLGDAAEIHDQKAEVRAVTSGHPVVHHHAVRLYAA